MRRANRTDGTQKAIVGALEAAGASVEVLGRPLDLLVGFRGSWTLLEVKSSRYEAEQRDTPTRRRQIAFAERHPNGGKVATVWTAEQAIKVVTQ